MLFLALRHLIARKKQTFLIFSGIALGTLTYVFVSGMQLGFREFIIQQLVENDAHLKITAHEEIISPETLNSSFFPEKDLTISWIIPPFGKRDEPHIVYPQGWFEKLSKEPEVTGYSEQLVVQAIASRSGAKATANLIGIIPDKQMNVTIIEKYMTSGNFQSVGFSGNKIVMGEGLLKEIGARVNESIFLSTGGSEPRPFKVVGTFKLGINQIDDAFIFAALRDVQQLNGTPGRISQIAVRLIDVSQARNVAEKWGQNSHDKVQSWDQASAHFLSVFKIQDLFRIFITVGIMLVASFGIYNVLSIIVNQKKREIAILRSLGYPPKDILNLFLAQGVILGITGAIVGLGLGFLVCVYMKNLDIDIGGRKGLTISFDASIYYSGFLMSCLSSIFASILPARAASKMTPIDIIRSEG